MNDLQLVNTVIQLAADWQSFRFMPLICILGAVIKVIYVAFVAYLYILKYIFSFGLSTKTGRIIRVPYRIFSHVKAAIALYQYLQSAP